jgi:hypothetical protein
MTASAVSLLLIDEAARMTDDAYKSVRPFVLLRCGQAYKTSLIAPKAHHARLFLGESYYSRRGRRKISPRLAGGCQV